MITNRSRTEGRLLSAKIPLPPGLVDRAPELTAELRDYLKHRPEVAVGKEAPKVYLSSLGSSAAAAPLTPEVTLTCHTNVMVRRALLRRCAWTVMFGVRCLLPFLTGHPSAGVRLFRSGNAAVACPGNHFKTYLRGCSRM